MSAKNEDSIPSAKMKEIENGKVVVKPNNQKQVKETPIKEKAKFPFYQFFSELSFLGIIILCLNIMRFSPSMLFSYSYDSMTYTLENPKIGTIILLIVVPGLALINTYYFIFSLHPSHRGKIYVIRLLNIVALLTFVWPIAELPSQFNISRIYDLLIGVFIFILYCFASQFILRIFLLTSKDTIKSRLFRKAIAGSPSELEWRKYNTISGYLAISLGILPLQGFWLLYHVFIRPSLVPTAKRKLIINSLNFEEDVNLSTASLDLGFSLEETIFLLKQLQLKRHVRIEFTRYGAILKEVRKAKWFSFVIQEKYDAYLNKQKMTEYQLKANRFVELTERNKLKLSDFRRVLEIDDNFDLNDLILLLPPKVAKIRKPMVYTHYHLFFNHDQALLHREKITKIFIENGERIFGKKTTKPPAKSKTK